MDKSKTVVIAGAGVGGLVAAYRLWPRIGREHRIVLIDRAAEHVYTGSLLWVMTGDRRPRQIRRDLGVVEKRGVEYVNAEITSISAADGIVATDLARFSFDFLVLALGADLMPEEVPGLREAGIGLYDLAGAVRAQQALRSFAGGTLAILVCDTPFKCPAAPYEAAFLVEAQLRQRGLRKKSDVQVYTPEPQPLPVAGPAVGDSLRELLASRGIGFNPGRKVKAVRAVERVIEFEDGGEAGFDLLLFVPPHRPPRVVRESDLSAESGWVPVHPRTLATKADHVFAVGDVTSIPLAPAGVNLPKAGVFAHFQAETVAESIATEIESGEEGAAVFDGTGFCFLEVGDGKAGYAKGSFYAEPKPKVELWRPSRSWHWGKILFERYWLWRWF